MDKLKFIKEALENDLAYIRRGRDRWRKLRY